MKKILLAAFLLSFTGVFAQNMDNYIELFKSDIKTERKAMITEVMKFDEKQAEIFWPIYNEFEYKLDKLSSTRVANIKDFAANYDVLSDEKAKQLIENAFDFQEERLELNEDYYEKFSKALGPIVAAKYMQLEYEIQLLIDLSINSNLPLAKKPGGK